MALVLASHTEPVEQMKAVMEAAGLKASVSDPNAKPSDEPTPPVETPSEQPEQPGDTPAAETGGESDPASEAGTKPQDKQATPPAQPPKETKPADHLSRGNFKSKLGKLEDRVTRLSDELDTERGDKSRLRKQLEDAQAELATFKKPEGIDAKKDASGPVKPKRPTKADFDFDEDKYEAALDKHEEDMSTYHSAVAEKTVADRLAQAEAERKQEAQAAEAKRAQAEFASRMAAGQEGIPELTERLDQLEQDVNLPPVIEDFIFTADHPAELMNFFAGDAIDSGSSELTRIAGLSPMQQVRTLTLLEARLVREREEKNKPEPEAPADKAEPPVVAPVVPPARPKPAAKPPVEPIEPLGSRSSASTPSLTKAVGKEYFRLRNSGVNR